MFCVYVCVCRNVYINGVFNSRVCVYVCRVGICISVARVGVWLRISEAQGLLLHFHDYYGCLLPYGVVGVQVGAGSGWWGVQATVPLCTHTLKLTPPLSTRTSNHANSHMLL